MIVEAPTRAGAARERPALRYQTGFGNELASEALPGALPIGQNSPQRPPHGLYAELISGTAFTVPRAEQLRTWMYRMQPSARHAPFARIGDGLLRCAPITEAEAPARQLRWDPLPIAESASDFITGMVTIAAGGDLALHSGCAVHVYRVNRAMDGCFVDADGELMLVPEQGELLIATELGTLAVAPGEIAVLPRGLHFRVEPIDATARGYVCENYGAPFRLPELGPIGSNGLASPRDFLYPVAACDAAAQPCRVVRKFMGKLWAADYDHSPLDVVAFHGNLAPYKYELARFQALGSVSFDHPDPSLFTVLHSPSSTPGVANADFVLFPPRWSVAEHTFRPPYFHRNAMSELMGLVRGAYDGKAEGFAPGAISLHNALLPHGPDTETFERASSATLAPVKLDDTLAFMWESRHVLTPTRFALDCPQLQADYETVWNGLQARSKP